MPGGCRLSQHKFFKLSKFGEFPKLECQLREFDNIAELDQLGRFQFVAKFIVEQQEQQQEQQQRVIPVLSFPESPLSGMDPAAPRESV